MGTQTLEWKQHRREGRTKSDECEEERQIRRRRRSKSEESRGRRTTHHGAKRNADSESRRGRNTSRPRHENDIDQRRQPRDLRASSAGARRGASPGHVPLRPPKKSLQTRHQGGHAAPAAPDGPKEKPNLACSGLLAAESNSTLLADGTTVVLKYHEPSDARAPAPKYQWKLFAFKGAEILETIDLSRQSFWRVGREASVSHIFAEHPSISKQHAILQFRYVEKTNEFGERRGRVRPYLLDLDSANGTLLNKQQIPARRYLELREKDMIQFAHSTREYVLMLQCQE
ncbi:BgTH12-04097 [Blumeria graminis f. sp. triticale]|uniref:BgTH12-04097 n=1 Tax=Blumeria graminis f. sp. triticale TaxID=1689686 RepID=A0A9W4CX40_BLUGR|nr:BgTH12-04097 [Blumeria graminis f. sp. triticale]